MLESILDFLKNLPEELIVFLISLLPLIELRGAVPVGALLFELPFHSNLVLSVLGNLLPIPFILLFIPKILDFLARFKFFRPIVEWLRKKADKHSSKVLGDEERDEVQETEGKEASPAIGSAEATALCEGSTESALSSLEATPQDESTPSSAGASKETAAPHPKGKRKMSKAIFTALLLFVAIPVPGTGGWTGALVAALFDLPKRWSLLAIFLGILLCGVIMCLASYGVLGFLSFLL